MLKKFIGCSAVAAVALLVGQAPAFAHDGRDDLCGGVVEGEGDAIQTGSGKVLLLGSSAPCLEAEKVAVDEAAEEDAGSKLANLPNDGLVYFSLDATDLAAEDQAQLDEIIAAVKESGDSKIVIRGHADRSGGDEYNQQLSEKRAETIAAALVAAGVPEEQVRTMGLGETDLAVVTEDGVAMRQNRRAAIQPDDE